MSSLPEGTRRIAKTEGDGEDEDEGLDLPPSVRPAGSGPSKFSGIQAAEGLQRVGGQTATPYPVERRGGGNSRAVQETPAPAPVARPAAPLPPPPVAEAEPEAPVQAPPRPAAPAMARTADDRGLASTGISGLDAQYGGGLPNGSLFLLTSEPTTATGVFAAQYAGAGLSEGEIVYYFSMEQPAGEVRRAISNFVKTEKDLERLRIIDGYPSQFVNVPEDARRRMGIGAGDNALATLESLLVNPQLTGPVRIIVESMSELLAQHDAERVFRVLRVLKGVVAALNGTAVVTLVSPLHEPGTVAQAKHIADGVVEFHVERKGFGIYPYIAVTKMRGVTGSARLLLFKETESGLWLESTKRVF